MAREYALVWFMRGPNFCQTCAISYLKKKYFKFFIFQNVGSCSPPPKLKISMGANELITARQLNLENNELQFLDYYKIYYYNI